MASPGETTRDRWAFEGPYYIENRGKCTVPEQFLKNVVWQVTEGGYCIPDPFIKNHYIKVEFSNDSLCWAEVRLLDRAGDWDPEGPQWEIFRPALAELGCDIYLTKLTAEELFHITEESEAQTSHTCTPAPSETSEDTEASRPEQIQVLSPEPPSTGEQRLAVLAESLHISPQFPSSNCHTTTIWGTRPRYWTHDGPRQRSNS